MNSKKYKITADYKKSSYQEEYWDNLLSNGKSVTILSTTFFRSGTFTITLTEKEKVELLKQDKIILNNYEIELDRLTDGQDHYVTIENIEDYGTQELLEIKKLLYVAKEEWDTVQTEEEIEEEFNEDVMEENNWVIDDTIYGFTSGCRVFLIEEYN